MTMSIAFFNCPHCVDSFAFDFQKLKPLTLHSRVRVRCPGCQNVVEVVTNAYSVIHNADPEQYQWGEILEILPPDPRITEDFAGRWHFNTSIAFLMELVNEMQSGGNDLKPMGQAQPITASGVQGRSLNMQSTSPFPDANGQVQKERDWLVTLPRSDGSVLYIVFIAPEAQFNQFKPTYENMLRSVQLQ